MTKIKESAVSPVIGVMLMLVVVIIIAAIVSAFSGGLVGTDTKPLQATILGKYSYSANMLQMFHAGGDALPTQKINIQVYMNDEDFGGRGSVYKGLHHVMNKSRVYNSAGDPWLDPSTGSVAKVPVWLPGETMFFNSTSKGSLTKKDVGKSLILEVLTVDAGIVSKSKVIIEP